MYVYTSHFGDRNSLFVSQGGKYGENKVDTPLFTLLAIIGTQEYTLGVGLHALWVA